MWASSHERKRGDWFLYILMLCAVMTLPLVVQQSRWMPQAGRLVWVAFWASLAGMLLAYLRFPAWLGWLAGVIGGIEYSFQYATRLLPTFPVFWSDLSRAITWVWEYYWRRVAGPEIPFARSAAYVAVQARLTVSNLSTWLVAVRSGAPTRDVTVLMFGAGLVLWLLAWNAGYELFGRRRPFAALLPLGVAVVANVSFTDIGMAYVHFYLGVTMLILVWSTAGRMEAIWKRLGLDFSTDIRRDAMVAGTALSVVVFVAAMAAPYLTYNRAVFWFWGKYGPKFDSFYKQLDKAFAGRNPVPEPTKGPKGLPSHLVGGGANLSEQPIFWVTTNEPAPPSVEEMLATGGDSDPVLYVPKHYWRERTYDVYTGHGWDSSERRPVPTQGKVAWTSIPYPYIELTQTFKLKTTGRNLAYGANEVVSLDRDYRVLTRGEGDLAAIMVDAATYVVSSAVPDITEEELRSAEATYPEWVRQRYLTLPRIPTRVRDTAAQVVSTAGATSRYDKAKAIETYLRGYAYDLNLEPPSLDADVVEFFLFTARRGYCDYSASAMVVMLRAVGVAARYASGYAMGTYDYASFAWVVTEANAHAWAEVYFPGHGWVEFEPTPAQSPFLRPSSRAAYVGDLNALGEQPQKPTISPFWLGVGILLVVVAFVVVWPPRYLRRHVQPPREIVLRAYDRLVARARWLGLSPVGGQTARQYVGALSREVERRADFAQGAGQRIALIGGIYERTRYSELPVSDEEARRVDSAWRRLRSVLTRLLFVRVRKDQG